AALGATLAQLGPAVSTPAGEQGLGAWAAGYGLGGKVDGDGNAAGFDHLGGGVVAGIDWRVTAETTLGVALGYGRSELDHDNGDDGEIDTVRASLYGAWRPAGHDGRLVLDGAFGAGLSDYETTRRIAFAGLDRTAEGESDGHELAARLGAGYRLDLGAWQMTPQAGLSYVRLHQDGYAETGAGAAGLVVEDQTVDSVQGRLGLAAARSFTTAAGTALTPTAALAWRHEFADAGRVIDAAFAGVPGVGFRVAGADADRDAVELALGVSATTAGGTTWHLGYGASLSGDETAHGLVAGVRVTW
ncbi:MAG TPA: autotransporter outer membrane beta-barrel domain-containing protein, partial [Alphaproteobacteria bacterium]|nr:autotransporter outer membrane beta-barrel domain-containing protein [Alphaproteobacteria bacterium]